MALSCNNSAIGALLVFVLNYFLFVWNVCIHLSFLRLITKILIKFHVLACIGIFLGFHLRKIIGLGRSLLLVMSERY